MKFAGNMLLLLITQSSW